MDGINSGLDIAGQGTFKFNITDDDGKIHTIRIPNSLYVPNLKRCLLLPQHWVQEAGDKQIWMGNYRDNCVLNWRGGKKTVSFQLTTNVPVFYTASSSWSYCAFTATFKAMEALYFRWEKVLEFPGRRDLIDIKQLVPEEFVAEENPNYDKEVSVVEEFQRTMKPSKCQTYLLNLRTRIHPRPSATVLSSLTPYLLGRRVKTLSLLPPTIRLS